MYSNLVKNMIKKLNETELLLTQKQDNRVEILGSCRLDTLEHFIEGLQIFDGLRSSDSTLHLISNHVEVRLRNPNAAIDTDMLHWHPVLVELDLYDLDDLETMLKGIWWAIEHPIAD